MSHKIYVDSEEYRKLVRESEELVRLKRKMADDAERMDTLTVLGHEKALFVTADGLECLVRNPSRSSDWPHLFQRPVFEPHLVIGGEYRAKPSPVRAYIRTSERCSGIPVYRERR